MTRRLNQLSNAFVYFATFKVYGTTSLADHISIKSNFSAGIRQINKRSAFGLQYRAVSEMGYINTDIHYHLCIYSDLPVSEAIIKKIWSKACANFPCSSVFEEAWYSRRAAINYMFKHEQKKKKFLRLFKKNTIPITWQSRDFFGMKMKDYIKATYAEWHIKRQVSTVRLPPFPDAINNSEDDICIIDASDDSEAVQNVFNSENSIILLQKKESGNGLSSAIKQAPTINPIYYPDAISYLGLNTYLNDLSI